MLKPGTSPHGAIVRGPSSMRSRIQACEKLLGRRRLWIHAAKSPGANRCQKDCCESTWARPFSLAFTPSKKTLMNSEKACCGCLLSESQPGTFDLRSERILRVPESPCPAARRPRRRGSDCVITNSGYKMKDSNQHPQALPGARDASHGICFFTHLFRAECKVGHEDSHLA